MVTTHIRDHAQAGVSAPALVVQPNGLVKQLLRRVHALPLQIHQAEGLEAHHVIRVLHQGAGIGPFGHDHIVPRAMNVANTIERIDVLAIQIKGSHV